MPEKSSQEQSLDSVFAAALAPAIEADGGELYLVSANDREVHVHLGGTCAGCPGVDFTKRFIEEAVRSNVSSSAKLMLTAGWIVPPNARRVRPL
ncbi:MAG: NifU family protein [Polyangiaceae bacterium]|nr:NifU family protein [Polyangiaceae bacterium]